MDRIVIYYFKSDLNFNINEKRIVGLFPKSAAGALLNEPVHAYICVDFYYYYDYLLPAMHLRCRALTQHLFFSSFFFLFFNC